MRDNILESIFLDTTLWEEAIIHGVDRHITHDCLEKFADPHHRAALCMDIANGEYKIKPPHTGYKKKDDGGERMFLANEPEDRLLLNVIYKWLMRNEASMIHPSCKSYQEGIGIGKIVRQIAERINHKNCNNSTIIAGRKFDIHKYFETIGREHIHRALSVIENDYGKSSIIDLLSEYYDSDLFFDTRRQQIVECYQGIKQGCAVSAWLANVLLYSLDEELSKRKGLYVRYSDDIIYIGEDYEEVTTIIRERLYEMGLKLNERKVTDIIAGEYFCFLGFEIHGANITLSHKWVKHFQQQIDKRTIHNVALIKKVRKKRKEGGGKQEELLNRILAKITQSLERFLLYGNGRFSWATEVLPTVNSPYDILQLTTYCLDSLRAVYTGHTGIGGLGKSLKQGIQRGKGRHVRSNREATKHLEKQANGLTLLQGFLSLSAAQKTISNKWLFRAISVNLVDCHKHPIYGQRKHCESQSASREETIKSLESLYANYLTSQPNGDDIERFYGCSLDEMSVEMLIKGKNRKESLEKMELYLSNFVDFSILQTSEDSWYWQSATYPQLVLLKEWFE